jgi:large subunit ribosomal protein L30
MPERKKPKASSGAGREARPARPKAAPRKPRPPAKTAPAAPAAAPARPRAEEAGAIAARPSAGPGSAAPGTITILQFGSGIGCPIRHKRVLRALGLRHPHHRVVRPDNPAVRGMVATVPHLVRIVEDRHGA